MRIVDESMWPQDPNAAVSDLKRFESICNLVFAALPVWMICPYDASLVTHVLPDAYRTHPVIRDARVSRQASVAYLQPGEFFKALDVEEQLAPPPADARVLRTATPGQARSFIVAEASAAGLHPDRIQDLELATCEMATNAARHAHQGAEMHVWTEPGEIVCRAPAAVCSLEISVRRRGASACPNPEVGQQPGPSHPQALCRGGGVL